MRRRITQLKTVRGTSSAGDRAKGHNIPSLRAHINKEIEVQDSQIRLCCWGIQGKLCEKDDLGKISPLVPSFVRQTWVLLINFTTLTHLDQYAKMCNRQKFNASVTHRYLRIKNTNHKTRKSWYVILQHWICWISSVSIAGHVQIGLLKYSTTDYQTCKNSQFSSADHRFFWLMKSRARKQQEQGYLMNNVQNTALHD